jgi:hypothetical protein
VPFFIPEVTRPLSLTFFPAKKLTDEIDHSLPQFAPPRARLRIGLRKRRPSALAQRHGDFFSKRLHEFPAIPSQSGD